MGLAGLVRLAGSLTVLAAATGLGAAVGLDYRRRIQLLTQLRRMFLLLAGEIRSSRTPAAEAFGRMAGRMEPPFGKWLKTLADRLEAGEGESFVSEAAKIFVSPSAPAGHRSPRGRLQAKTADTYYRCLPFLMQNFL